MNDVFIKVTRDGSNTLFHSVLNEHYHSIHGALAESKHVFIKEGLNQVSKDSGLIHVFEIGFGTGLNALLTAEWALQNKIFVNYSTLETSILPAEIWQSLDYHNHFDWIEAKMTFDSLHSSPWNVPCQINPFFILRKLKCSYLEPDLYRSIVQDVDIVFFDAFAPSKQSEMWNLEGFKVLFDLMKKDGRLVTYCAQGAFKRNLRQAGFEVQAVTGPPYKRQMTLGLKS